LVVTSNNGKLYSAVLFVKENNYYTLNRSIILIPHVNLANVAFVHKGNKTVASSVVNTNGKLFKIQLPFKGSDSSNVIQYSIQSMLVSLSNIAKSQYYLQDAILVTQLYL
jgi:hypothetical protein